MKVKKLKKVLDINERYAVWINKIFIEEVNKEELLKKYGEYKIISVSSGIYQEETRDKPFRASSSIMCVNVKDRYHEQG